VELHIAELVLPAAWASGRAETGAALERELGRLIERGELPSLLDRGGEIGRLEAKPFERAPVAGAAELGEAAARAIDGGLRG
jgi:hypothetical protein